MSEPIPDVQAVAQLVTTLLKRLKPVLVGHPHYVQGAVLGEALAICLVGHPDFMREQILAGHIDYVRGLVPNVELEVFGGRRHPSNTQTDS